MKIKYPKYNKEFETFDDFKKYFYKNVESSLNFKEFWIKENYIRITTQNFDEKIYIHMYKFIEAYKKSGTVMINCINEVKDINTFFVKDPSWLNYNSFYDAIPHESLRSRFKYITEKELKKPIGVSLLRRLLINEQFTEILFHYHWVNFKKCLNPTDIYYKLLCKLFYASKVKMFYEITENGDIMIYSDKLKRCKLFSIFLKDELKLKKSLNNI